MATTYGEVSSKDIRSIERVTVTFTKTQGLPMGQYRIDATVVPPSAKATGTPKATLNIIKGGSVRQPFVNQILQRVPGTSNVWTFSGTSSEPDNPNGAYWAVVEVEWIIQSDPEKTESPVTPYP